MDREHRRAPPCASSGASPGSRLLPHVRLSSARPCRPIYPLTWSKPSLGSNANWFNLNRKQAPLQLERTGEEIGAPGPSREPARCCTASGRSLVAEMPRQHPQPRNQDSLRLLQSHRPFAPALADSPLPDAPAVGPTLLPRVRSVVLAVLVRALEYRRALETFLEFRGPKGPADAVNHLARGGKRRAG